MSGRQNDRGRTTSQGSEEDEISPRWTFAEMSHWVASSPTVVDGTVFVGSHGSTLYAVDAATGEQEWAFEEPSNWVNSSPTVVDNTVSLGSDDGTLYAVDLPTDDEE